MIDAREIVMGREELAFWARIRRRGAFWYLVHKGLLFLLFYPLAGHFAAGWDWHPRLLVEAWVIGIVCGGFVWMRKELRYRFTLDHEGQLVPDGSDD
jgi:hypothetical protein